MLRQRAVLSRNHAVGSGERGRLDRRFRPLAENIRAERRPTKRWLLHKRCYWLAGRRQGNRDGRAPNFNCFVTA
jgi:hypothetical protein